MSAQATILYNEFEYHTFKIIAISPNTWSQWVKTNMPTTFSVQMMTQFIKAYMGQ